MPRAGRRTGKGAGRYRGRTIGLKYRLLPSHVHPHPSRASATTASAVASAHETAPTQRQLTRFVLTLVQPYGARLVIVLIAMLAL